MAPHHTLKRNRLAPNRQMKFDLTSKYCRKFCRTGFCPRGPSCHFAHDPSKIAICSTFIYGKCTNSKCLLSHTKTPDNMPDCLFFQKGYCRTENCCYRHVKVGDNAQPCLDFIKGVCLLGLQCQNIHIFECRTLKKTGHCPKANKCNFYHPKETTKPLKKQSNLKSSQQQKYKKVNATITVPLASSSSSSDDKEKLSQNKLLNLLLEKRLKSPIKPNPKVSPIVKSFQSGSDFISLSTDVSTDPCPSIFLNLNQEKAESKCNPQASGAKKKYFITDNDEEKLSDYINANASLSSEQTCRPRLKIIPDFLLVAE